MTRRLAVVRAPSGLGLRARGVEGLGDALLAHGLAGALGARIAATVAPPLGSGLRDPESGVLNGPEIVAYAVTLADAIGEELDAGNVPLVLGGDCSVLLGGALALRRRGGAGLLFLDGHADFYQPSAEPLGEAASMDLALVLGHGPPMVVDLEGRSPLVRAEDAVIVGFRDGEEQVRDGSQPLPGSLLAIDLAAIRTAGAIAVTERALAHLTRPGAPERFWVHVDADVLDDAVMPAVDYRLPGGLSVDELANVVAAAVATGRVAGVEVTIYNPTLDPDGSAGAALTAALGRGLGGAAHGRYPEVEPPGRLLQAALNGDRAHPALPRTPDELAAEARAAVDAGARSLHLHPYDEDGRETLEAEPCAAALRAVRAACPGIPISLSTSAAIEADTERRHRLIAAWAELPDLATVNQGEDGAEELCHLLVARGIGIEAGLLSLADAHTFVASGIAPSCVRAMVEPLDPEPHDAVAHARAIEQALAGAGVQLEQVHHGEGIASWAVNGRAAGRGHGIRTGLEDTPVLPTGRTASGNGELVAAAAALLADVRAEPG